MSAKATQLGESFAPAGELHPYGDLRDWPDPGIWICENGTTTAFGIKSRRYRPYDYDREAPGIYDSDIVPLTNAIFTKPYKLPPEKWRIGIEAELNSVDDQGEPLDLYPNNEPFSQKLATHPELWRNTYETDAKPENTAYKAYCGLIQQLYTVQKELNEIGGSIDPAAARMQDIPGKQDVTPNAYVKTMVNILGNNILRFIGTGIHEHYDLHVGYSPIVSRYLRVLAPYLNVGLQAAPFAYGEKQPKMSEWLNNDELADYDNCQPHSVRYLTRYSASKNGGVGERIVHDTLHEALLHADHKLTAGEISNPSRHLGSHADVRNRYDPPSFDQPDHPGRIELCVKDTSAYRLDTLVAWADLTQAIIYKLETVAEAGEPAIEALHTEFPRLFGKNPDKDSIAKDQLERAHRNSVEIAYNGAESYVETGTGHIVPVSEQIAELIRFAEHGGLQLSNTTKGIIYKSLAPVDKVLQIAANYRDEKGLPSLTGYYATGVGTAAAWMIVRANAAAENGIRNIMRDGTYDRVRAFGSYLQKLSNYPKLQ